MEFKHKSVLLNECIEGLNIKSEGIYVDGTLGGAGHSREICKRLSKKGILIGIDRDKDALKASEERLKEFDCRKVFVQDNYSNIKNILEGLNIKKIDGALLDLGVSSFQLDNSERGFSYMQEAPLDMRMNQEDEFTAWQVVNHYSEGQLTKLIKEYGEERWAKRIAQFIVKERAFSPVDSTHQLVDIIKKAIPKGARKEGPHPAKRTFQAIRIEVNDELGQLEKAVEDFIDVLGTGGRLCVITFHSLEDRIVKEIVKKHINPCTCPKEFPICVCGNKPDIDKKSAKLILPSEDEVESNPRSRSAKLRIAEKI